MILCLIGCLISHVTVILHFDSTDVKNMLPVRRFYFLLSSRWIRESWEHNRCVKRVWYFALSEVKGTGRGEQISDLRCRWSTWSENITSSWASEWRSHEVLSGYCSGRNGVSLFFDYSNVNVLIDVMSVFKYCQSKGLWGRWSPEFNCKIPFVPSSKHSLSQL
jgi:hypothetical protein